MSVHLANALGGLKGEILSLASLAEDQVSRSLKALHNSDTTLAQAVIEQDDELDRKEVELEEECLKVLALYQPVAHDLRFVVSALKLTNDLERIGDYGAHIAHRAISLAGMREISEVLDLDGMGKLVLTMLQKSIDALINQNVKAAREVWTLDEEIDAIHKGNYSKLETQLKATPNRAGTLLQLLSVSRYLERIADLATNIADDVVYLVEGRMTRHHHFDKE